MSRLGIAIGLLGSLAFGEEVRLRGGDVLHGTVVERHAIHVVFDHDDLGRITIRADRLVEEEPVEPGEIPLPKPPARPWKLGLAWGGAFTNDDEGAKLDLNMRLLVDYEAERTESKLDVAYIFSTKNSGVDTNNLTAIYTQSWFRPDSRWFYFARPRYDYDAFRSWEQRVTAHGGVGYRWVRQEALEISPSVGAGFRKDIGSQEETAALEGLVGLDLRWKLGRHDFSLGMAYYPSLNAPEHRFTTLLDWRYLLDERYRVSFLTHLGHEFATDPDPGFPENNIKLTWALQWDF
ncbi:MAG: DUF481 domain-containing protein [Planctomycetota bacterium]|jgi:hypothetical protein